MKTRLFRVLFMIWAPMLALLWAASYLGFPPDLRLKKGITIESYDAEIVLRVLLSMNQPRSAGGARHTVFPGVVYFNEVDVWNRMFFKLAISYWTIAVFTAVPLGVLAVATAQKPQRQGAFEVFQQSRRIE